LNIAYLTFDSIAEGVGTSQVKNLVLKLKSPDLNVTLVSFEKTAPSKTLRVEMQTAGITWYPLKFGKFGMVFGALRILRLKWRILFLQNIDLYHCRSDLATYACLSTFKSRPVLWDVRSLWADQKSVVDGKQKKFVNAILRYIEKKCASRASAVNLLTQRSIAVLESRNGAIPSIRSVIPTCVDLNLFEFQPKSTSSSDCLLSGTISDFYDVDLISEFVEIALREYNIDTTWVRPMETLQQFQFTEIRRTITAQHHEMPRIVAAHSFGLILCKRSEAEALSASSPTKAAEFLATGRPLVVSPNIGDLSHLIIEHKVGVVLEESSEVSEKIKELISLNSDGGLAQRCRYVAETYYDLEKAVLSYKEVYRKILEDHA
jgi:hypothetical protein